MTRNSKGEFGDHGIKNRHTCLKRVRHARSIRPRKHVIDEKDPDVEVHHASEVIDSFARGVSIGQEVKEGLGPSSLGKDELPRSSRGVIVFQR